MKKTFTLFAFISILISIAGTARAQTILYVNTNTQGANNGNSWTDAYKKLSDALQFTISNPTIQYEIRVAAGTYYPTGEQSGTNRDSTFLIRQGGGIKLLGGYDASTGIRNIEANLTILSGEIGSFASIIDNSYHILVIAGLPESADSVVVDGLIIIEGRADGANFKTYNGQAVFRNAGGGINLTGNNSGSKTTIRNCSFMNNFALNNGGGLSNLSSSPSLVNCNFSLNTSMFGGGMSNYTSSPAVIECTFSTNYANSQGGGMYNTTSFPAISNCSFSENISGGSGGGIRNSSSSPIITNSEFLNNEVTFYGGGISNNNSSPEIANCTFTGNESRENGGGMDNDFTSSPDISGCTFSGNTAVSKGGAMVNYNNSSPDLTNCLIFANSATDGGGIYSFGSSPSLSNCTISGNIAGVGGGMSNFSTSSPNISNSIIYGNSSGLANDSNSIPTITYSNVQEDYPGSGNINQDPLFVNAPNYTTAPFTEGDYRLQACSPSNNTGSNAGYSGNINSDTDLDGNPRLFGTTIDMGAYEFQDTIPPLVATCQNQTVNLNSSGISILSASLLNLGSTGCSLTFTINSEATLNYTCADIGPQNLIMTVTDRLGQTATCSATVTVQDVIHPVFTCPANPDVNLNASCQFIVPDLISDLTATDNCDSISIIQSPTAGTTIELSHNSTVFVTITVTDGSGNSSICYRTLTGKDVTPPEFSCPANQDINLNGNCQLIVPNLISGLTGTDNCGSVSFIQNPTAGTLITSTHNATVPVTITASDGNGNSSTCNVTLTGKDIISPIIECPASIMVNTDPGQCNAVVQYDTPIGIDNCFGATTIRTSGPGSGTIFPVGQTIITHVVTDVAGNATSCSFTISVMDDEELILECFNQTITFNGETSIPLDANDLAEASDNCGVQNFSLSPSFINSNQVGQTVPVLVTVTDVNGNTATCTSQISVGGLPTGWSQNVNGVGCANGNAIDYNPSTEVWTATSTNCLYGSPFTSDAMGFAQRTLCGNGSITAQVTGISGTSLGWAGVVMRESSAAGAKKAQLTTNMAGNQSRREFRVITNGSAVPQNFAAQNRYWLRVVRSGNQFIMYNSPNGAQWYLVGAQTIAMGNCIEVGLVATNYASNSTVISTFANVSYNGSGPMMQSSIAENNNPAATANIQPDFKVYPNPTAGELNLDLKEYMDKNLQIELYSIEGKLMQMIRVDEVLQNTQSFQLDGYASGMYFIKLKSEGLPDVTKRVILVK